MRELFEKLKKHLEQGEAAVLVTVIATLIGEAFFAWGLRDANIIMIYILGVLVTVLCFKLKDLDRRDGEDRNGRAD